MWFFGIAFIIFIYYYSVSKKKISTESLIFICPEDRHSCISNPELVDRIMSKLKIMKDNFLTKPQPEQDEYCRRSLSFMYQEHIYDIYTNKKFLHIHYLNIDPVTKMKYVLFCTKINNVENKEVQVYWLYKERPDLEHVDNSLCENIHHFFAQEKDHKEKYQAFQKFLLANPSNNDLMNHIKEFL